MAFTEFTSRSGGSNLNAGTLDGSAEAAAAPLKTYTNGGWNSGTGVYTPAAGNPVTDGVAVGQWVSVYADAAAAPTGFIARVTAVSTTTITLSTTAKSGTAPTTAGTGLTAVVGGAWLGPTGASGFPVTFLVNGAVNSSSNPPRANYKNDQTYSITAQISVVAGSGQVTHQGYTTSFGDGGKATIDGGTSGVSYHLISGAPAGSGWEDLVLQNNGASGTADLMRTFVSSRIVRCVFASSRGSGVGNATASAIVECEAYNCNLSNTANQGGFTTANPCSFVRCVSHDNPGANSHGFYSNASSFVGCVSDSNGGAGFKLDQSGNNFSSLVGCVAYNNASDGALTNNSPQAVYLDSCLFVLNGGFGFRDNSSAVVALRNCAFYSNTSGPLSSPSGFTTNAGAITLTGNPFLDAPNGDFRLNTTAGAGTACRGTGRGTFTETAASYAGTVGYPDVGAAQHLETTVAGAPPVPLTAPGWAYLEG